MSEIQLMHYKQKTPEETVQFLQDILKNMKVEVTETWQERSSIGTYALRLDFRGTKIGANGKKAFLKLTLKPALMRSFLSVIRMIYWDQECFLEVNFPF